MSPLDSIGVEMMEEPGPGGPGVDQLVEDIGPFCRNPMSHLPFKDWIAPTRTGIYRGQAP